MRKCPHIRNGAHIGLKNCSLEAELDEAAQGTGLAFIVMADVFTKVLNKSRSELSLGNP